MTGVQPINLAADQARVIFHQGVSQIRLRPGFMADRIVVGSQAWVREPFALLPWADHLSPTAALQRAGHLPTDWPADVHFLADGRKPARFGGTRFARTLPRQLSRGFLQVLSVQVDQLQRWSPQDEAALGFTKADYIAAWNFAAKAVATFGGNPRGLRWVDNPQVRIITFGLVRQNIDAWLECRREAVAQSKHAAAVPETAAAGSSAPDMPVRRRAPSATNATGHERT
ncbi:hypothetical protein [Blastomonas sp.]|uniref:hypothetical protein n=1 Tax=Blastomonas sp. TaxID=1909299 RepID=UPI00391C57FD